ncbi:ABC-three component system middle component 6 [Providencia sp. VP23HZSY-1]|uniref:ABC-three component system middle component 6 n=1 Tax=Providencia sp. VP23HZSY-1 TaxID=3391806 RepID=UPI003AF47B7E
MILPTKVIAPASSLYCISAYVLDAIKCNESIGFDEILDVVNNTYPESVKADKLQLCLDFLFIIGQLEFDGENFKIILK